MMKGSCCFVCKIATLLAGLGALNWGLLALFQLDLVTKIFGGMTTASRVVYIVIGVAGLMKLVSLVITCPCCKMADGECKK
jgi:uncharacterized membrane protein YuzA (DUF378 family)